MMRRWQDSKWVRRFMFIGVNAGVSVVIAALVIVPVRDVLADRDARISDQRKLLDRFQALAGQEAAVEAAAKLTSVDAGEYLTGRNDGVVNADLQTRLKALVETAGAHQRAVRTLPPQTVEQLRYVGSRVEIFGSLASIHRAIAAIETAKPYLFVRGALIKSPPAGRPDAPQEPVLDAQLDVFGALHAAASGR